jgi:NAD(P)-dependent dehydrogenase (short-subunit alcohol dehydrogenase family)
MSQDASVVVGAAEGVGLAVSEKLARSHPGRLVLADVQGAKVAGVHAQHPALDMSEDLFFDLLRVNLVGVYLAAQTFAKRMIDAGVRGLDPCRHVRVRPPTSPTWSCSCSRSKAR